MKWQARTVAALLVTILAAASAQTQFNMGGVGGTNASAESYLPQAESMGSNWTQINCEGLSSGVVDDLLREAYTLGISVFLDHAGLSAGAPNIMSIAGGQYTEYQAESLRCPGDVGNRVPDALAESGCAWRGAIELDRCEFRA